MFDLTVFVISFALTLAGVAAFRRMNSMIGIVDVPNERSSHSSATPRGGGVAIVFVALTLYIAASLWLSVAPNLIFTVLALLVAAIGLIDDVYSIPWLPRLTIHIAAALIMVYFCGYYTEIRIPGLGTAIQFEPVAPLVTVLFVVWMTNAYNFMDGIDGIAGIQGSAVGFGWIAIGLLLGEDRMVMVGAVFGASCLGFLFHNWQPARIFMGDVGSTFLGFSFSALPISFLDSTKMQGAEISAAALFPLWLFIFDTVLTRVSQIVRLKKFWLPHREHFYQKLVIRGVEHNTVSIFFGVSGLMISVICALGLRFGGIFDVLFLLSLLLPPVLLLGWLMKKV